MSPRREIDLSALAALDPAGPPDPDAARSAPALALLERVVATPRDDAEPGADPAPAPARRAWATLRRRVALVGVAAVGLAVAVTVLPGPRDPSASAAWTAVPGALTSAETATAAERCRESVRNPAIEDRPTEASVAAAVPLVAEHRGAQSLVVIGADGWIATCLLDEGGYVASYSPAEPDAPVGAPAADEVAGWSGFMSLQPDQTALMGVVGRAGADVAAVSLHPTGVVGGAETVHATLEDGWFVAFWPVTAEHADLDPTASPLTVTLRTGQVRREPALPWGEREAPQG